MLAGESKERERLDVSPSGLPSPDPRKSHRGQPPSRPGHCLVTIWMSVFPQPGTLSHVVELKGHSMGAGKVSHGRAQDMKVALGTGRGVLQGRSKNWGQIDGRVIPSLEL